MNDLPFANIGYGEDWLWRPVLAGLFRAEGLFDGSLDLCMIADANHALDVRAYNEHLVNEFFSKR